MLGRRTNPHCTVLLVRRILQRLFTFPKLCAATTILLLIIWDGLHLDSFHKRQLLPVAIPPTLPPSLAHEKIFVAAIMRDSENFIRDHWGPQILQLVEALGVSNCFVSVVESASQDGTKSVLRELEARLDRLGVANSFVFGCGYEEYLERLKSVPGEGEDRTGWIKTGRIEQEWELRRIPYLAELRNQAMLPLRLGVNGQRFDRVLWINDVVFTVEDVVNLLSTQNGDYAAACALDFGDTPDQYYDTFVLRDHNGHKTASQSFPYFFSSSDIRLLVSHSPIPVKSCWNGLPSPPPPSTPPTLSNFEESATPSQLITSKPQNAVSSTLTTPSVHRKECG